MLLILAVFLWARSVTAGDHDPFNMTYMWTHQPSGNPNGQVNFYSIAFNVSSNNGDSFQTAYCAKTWADNNWFSDSQNYSTQAPVDQWLPCRPSSQAISDDSGFAFMLSPKFTIEDFSVAVKQNFTQTTSSGENQIIATSAPYHITANPADFICNITYGTVQYVQHDHGDCGTPWDFHGFSIPIAKTQPACEHAKSVTLSFGVAEVTKWGEEVFVVGSVPELGAWDPKHAVHLSAEQYTSSNRVWTGGSVTIAAGTAFEFKYVQRNLDGSWLWECGENRKWTVGQYTCGQETVSTADWLRCGNH